MGILWRLHKRQGALLIDRPSRIEVARVGVRQIVLHVERLPDSVPGALDEPRAAASDLAPRRDAPPC